jgi:hypothetical protein
MFALMFVKMFAKVVAIKIPKRLNWMLALSGNGGAQDVHTGDRGKC